MWEKQKTLREWVGVILGYLQTTVNFTRVKKKKNEEFNCFLWIWVLFRFPPTFAFHPSTNLSFRSDVISLLSSAGTGQRVEYRWETLFVWDNLCACVCVCVCLMTRAHPYPDVHDSIIKITKKIRWASIKVVAAECEWKWLWSPKLSETHHSAYNLQIDGQSHKWLGGGGSPERPFGEGAKSQWVSHWCMIAVFSCSVQSCHLTNGH